MQLVDWLIRNAPHTNDEANELKKRFHELQLEWALKEEHTLEDDTLVGEGTIQNEPPHNVEFPGMDTPAELCPQQSHSNTEDDHRSRTLKKVYSGVPTSTRFLEPQPIDRCDMEPADQGKVDGANDNKEGENEWKSLPPVHLNDSEYSMSGSIDSNPFGLPKAPPSSPQGEGSPRTQEQHTKKDGLHGRKTGNSTVGAMLRCNGLNAIIHPDVMSCDSSISPCDTDTVLDIDKATCSELSLRKMDVICGRSSALTMMHPGNLRFRRIIDLYRASYHQSSRNRRMKSYIVDKILDRIKSRGRFVRNRRGHRKAHWVLATDAMAAEKVIKALRRPMPPPSPRRSCPSAEGEDGPPHKRACTVGSGVPKPLPLTLEERLAANEGANE